MRRIGLTLALASALFAAAPATAADKLRIGYLPVTGHAKLFVATEQGPLWQAGLVADIAAFVT